MTDDSSTIEGNLMEIENISGKHYPVDFTFIYFSMHDQE